MANRLSAIQHIVVLMMENRSFDQMLGFLYLANSGTSPTGQPYEGLTGDESNRDAAGRTVAISRIIASSPHPYRMPGADPGEGFMNTNLQLFGTAAPSRGQVATNQGFVTNFTQAIASDLAKKYSDSLPGTTATEIMAAYDPSMLPIMSALARGFAVCDHWHASAPTQTIPNRAFVAAGTSQGHLDNAVKSFTCPSIFGRLSNAKLDWAIYGYDSPPMTRLDFPDTISADASHFGQFKDFQRRCAAGTLPPYTFLEPSFGTSGNSQHPNYDVALGEQLFRDVYDAVRQGPGWNGTLLIITYDEHGGNFDHVPPPYGAAAPDTSIGEWGFAFDRFGVRVPALLISPLIAAGTVFRAAKGVIDHTSILKTIAMRWNLPALTARDAAAPSLGDVLTLKVPRADDPLHGVTSPQSTSVLPRQSRPSIIERIHASKVSQLPIPNHYGMYDVHVPPAMATSDQVQDYIQMRTAAWDAHLRRLNGQAVPAPRQRASKHVQRH